ncbi:MAG: RluA family pseudouridine synthase, partial [Planctomycetota bacterium]
RPELVDVLAEQLGSRIRAELRLVHRLDKHTSGVMVLAKNARAQSLFSSRFQKRLVKKTYLALVTGIAAGHNGTVNAPLAHSRKKPGLMCVDHRKGKEAITNWKLLADFGAVALLAVRPLTGRTHQIRVHLPAIGLPLLIDPLYGNPRPFYLSSLKADYRLGKGRTEKPLIDRLTLHAYQIELPNSQADRPDSFIAGLDKKFTATTKMLTKHNPKGLDAFVNQDDFASIIHCRILP